jgi:hypothetical protein
VLLLSTGVTDDWTMSIDYRPEPSDRPFEGEPLSGADRQAAYAVRNFTVDQDRESADSAVHNDIPDESEEDGDNQLDVSDEWARVFLEDTAKAFFHHFLVALAYAHGLGLVVTIAEYGAKAGQWLEVAAGERDLDIELSIPLVPGIQGIGVLK